MSEAFANYNRRGLELSSFVMYGPKLMTLAAERAPKPKSSKVKFGRTMEELLAGEKK